MDTTLHASALQVSALSVRAQTPQVGDLYLQLQIDPETPGVLIMQSVQEVLMLPADRLTIMPGMPACVMGLINRRSHIHWVIDLAHLLQLQPLVPSQPQHTVIMLKAGTGLLAIAVAGVQGSVRLSADRIQSTHSSTLGLGNYSQGYVLLQDQIAQVLNAEAIVKAPMLLSV